MFNLFKKEEDPQDKLKRLDSVADQEARLSLLFASLERALHEEATDSDLGCPDSVKILADLLELISRTDLKHGVFHIRHLSLELNNNQITILSKG